MSREDKIMAILDEEDQEGLELVAGARKVAERILYGEKGYLVGEIKRDVLFEVNPGDEKATSRVDFLVTVNHVQAMLIKCAPGSLSSRERQVVAAARVFGPGPIPVAVVMDPHTAVVLDGITGRVIQEGLSAIPEREQLVRMIAEMELKPFAPEKVEREKRVLLAFDAIRCSIPKGAGGLPLDGDRPGEEKPGTRCPGS